MTNPLSQDLARDGYLTRTRRLEQLGHSRASISSAIRAGDLFRLCSGWVATLRAEQLAVVAVANYGKLASTSALASSGIWDGDDRRLHVVVRPNAHGTQRQLRVPIADFARPRFAPTGFDRHWSHELNPVRAEPPWRVSTVDALIQAARDLHFDQFIACVDSAMYNGQLAYSGLDTVFAALPAELHDLRYLVNPRAESGLESVARIRVGRFCQQIEVQAEIPGLNPHARTGRVDLLLDKWLIVELDGDSYHDPVIDRERNASAVRLGYGIHRFGYSQVLRAWRDVEATIRILLSNPPGRLPIR